jgi:protein TonB
VVAHALILALFPGLLERSRSKALPPTPIVARLEQPRPVVQPPAVIPAPQKQPDTPPTQAKPTPQPQPVLSVPTPSPAAPAVQAPVVAPRVAEVTTSDPAPSSPAPAARAEPAAAPAAPPATESADPATIGQYRIAVIAAARRFKRYPRIAMDNNWEGKAEVRLVIGPDGNIASVSIKTPSGFEVLDQQALDMIRRAKPQAPIPATLRGKGFTIDVPVVFSLREEG